MLAGTCRCDVLPREGGKSLGERVVMFCPGSEIRHHQCVAEGLHDFAEGASPSCA